jgi:hypothetical protein
VVNSLKNETTNSLQNAKNDARARVKELLQNEIPKYIRHLNDILKAAETDPSSALWKGHLKSGLFVKDNVKLVDNNAQKEHLRPGTASIAAEMIDGLSLEQKQTINIPDPAWEEADGVTGKRFGGGLEQNMICDRLNALGEE